MLAEVSRPLGRVGVRAGAGFAAFLLGALPSPGCAAPSPAPAPLFARSADGVPIAYEVRGTGATTVLFVHAWCCDRTFWRGTLDALASEWRVAALDLAGHGDSGHE